MILTLWNNREVRRFAAGATGVFVLLSGILLMLLYWNWLGLHQRQLEQNIAIVGAFVSVHPELEPELLSFISGEIPEELKVKGAEFAQSYGYTSRLSMSNAPIIFNAFRWQAGISFALFLMLFLGIGLICLRTLGFIYTHLKKVSEGTEQMMRGRFDFRLHEHGEGELPKLGYQFNQMSKRLEQTLEQLAEEKARLKELISDISHQLKTPLSSLILFNELLLEKPMNQEERTSFLEKSKAQLERIEWLIHSLLKISRLEAGFLTVQLKRQDIRATLESVMESLEHRSAAKRQTLRLSFEPDSHPILFSHDRPWLAEALENMIKNAIEYTPEHGTIDVSVQITSLIVTIRVKDSGIGIDEHELPYIFKRFYQGGRTNGRPHTSSGIGLALSKLLVEKHGGWIHVESVVGQGTTFSCIFPNTVHS